VLVDKAAIAGVELDAIADHLGADHVLLHVLRAGQQVGGGDVLLDAVAPAVDLALSDAR
jgi:hypothetical protein